MVNPGWWHAALLEHSPQKSWKSLNCKKVPIWFTIRKWISVIKIHRSPLFSHSEGHPSSTSIYYFAQEHLPRALSCFLNNPSIERTNYATVHQVILETGECAHCVIWTWEVKWIFSKANKILPLLAYFAWLNATFYFVDYFLIKWIDWYLLLLL